MTIHYVVHIYRETSNKYFYDEFTSRNYMINSWLIIEHIDNIVEKEIFML